MNRLVRPVMFAFEPDVVNVFSLISFGATGAPTLNTNYSKGICNVARNSISFTGTNSSSVTIASVSSFAGLYNGMTITGTNVSAATTISSMNPGAGTITLNQATTGVVAAFTAAGGQYTLTFGSQFTPFKRLDPYVRLLGLSFNWDESGTQGSASTGAISPAAPGMFLVGNNVSSSTLANIVIQFGTYSAGTFVAKDPGNGDAIRLAIQLTRSTAV